MYGTVPAWERCVPSEDPVERGEERRVRPTQRDELPVEQLIQNFDYLQSFKLTSQCSKDYARY